MVLAKVPQALLTCEAEEWQRHGDGNVDAHLRGGLALQYWWANSQRTRVLTCTPPAMHAAQVHTCCCQMSRLISSSGSHPGTHRLTMPTSTSLWKRRAAAPLPVKMAVPLPCSLALMSAMASSSVSTWQGERGARVAGSQALKRSKGGN